MIFNNAIKKNIIYIKNKVIKLVNKFNKILISLITNIIMLNLIFIILKFFINISFNKYIIYKIVKKISYFINKKIKKTSFLNKKFLISKK